MSKPSLSWWASVCLTAPVLSLAQSVVPPLAPTPSAPSVTLRDPAESLLREQVQRRRDAAVERDAQTIGLPERAQGQALPQGFPGDLPATGPTFLITAVRFDGDALMSQMAFLEVASPFLGRELGAAHIGALLDRLNQALIERGFTTSRAYVGPQNLADGVLRITFLAGRIEQILYRDQPVRAGAPLGLRLAMPMAEGDVLRLSEIEQAVDQLNRAGAQVQVQIRPGTVAGGSIVVFEPMQAHAQGTRYNLTLDNHGSSSTGALRLQLTGDRADTFGLMETVQWGLTTSQDTNALYAHMAVPMGYNTFSLMASASEYQNLIGDTALVYGTSGSVALAWNRLLDRDQTSKTALDLSLTRRHSRRAINNVSLTPQRQAVARMGVNRFERWPVAHGNAQWTVDLGVSKGLRLLGADRNAAEMDPQAARAQFTKLEFSTGLERPLSPAWQWRARLSGQWSAHPLFSSEQLFAGGFSSVRGLSDSAVGGDRGLSTRQEWVWTSAPAMSWPVPARLEPFVFLDGARLQTVADGRWQSALGVGGGLRLNWHGGQADLALGYPLRQPAELGATGWRLYAQMQWAL